MTIKVIADALHTANIRASDLNAIGITNQRETAVLWDRATGKPVANAIVWQDRRTARYCDELKERGLEEMIRHKTGLVIDSYFPAPRSNGCWITHRDCAIAPNAAKSLSAPSIPGWSGS